MICVPGALAAICKYPVWNPILQVFDETELRLQDYTLPFSFNTASVNYCQVLVLQKTDDSLKTSLIENVFRKLEEGGLTMKMRCGVWQGMECLQGQEDIIVLVLCLMLWSCFW